MNFSCTKDNIAKALLLTSGVTSKNISLPILNNVLIKADQQKIEIVATNLELAIIVTMRAKCEEAGAFTVPARTLAEFINLLPNEKIDFYLKENELVVSCGKSTTKIKGVTAEDFPVIPTAGDGKGFVINAKQLSRGLAKVLPAVARNEIRPELAGIFFGFNINSEKTLTLAATDSYRLAEDVLVLNQGEGEYKVVVPARTAQEIAKTLGDRTENNDETARLLVGENQLVINYDSLQIVSRLVSGQYPDYTQIMPREFNTTVLVSTSQLQKEIKAAGLFSVNGVNAVSVEVKPTTSSLIIASVSAQTGAYDSELEAEINGKENMVLLNHRYLLDGLANIDTEKTKLQIVNAENACLITPANQEKFRYVVMPIRQ